jgi:epoxyqueuosine reductase
MRAIVEDQLPRFSGPVATPAQPFASPEEAAAWVKDTAVSDIVGICRVEASDVYANRTVDARYAIVLGARMRYNHFVDVPSEDAAVECLRVYHQLGEEVIALASALRARGYDCTVEHPLGDASVMHIPLALKAGFGELGRHGSIIHPLFGPLFRIGSVLTNLELLVDTPVDAGIGAFCDRCKACRQFCPADAIPDERFDDGLLDPTGRPRYVVDTGKCFPYFARQNYCSACLAVCAWARKTWAVGVDGERLPFPNVPFGDVPPPVTLDAEQGAHPHPKIRRTEASPHHRSKVR